MAEAGQHHDVQRVHVNHLLGHGWLLLHVGQETGGAFEESPQQETVAVLGEPL